MERDPITNKFTANTKISTHTLTWSVTYAFILSYKATSISTHTLTWSVTMVQSQCHLISLISTHTLTWSVTNFPYPSSFALSISTHTLTWSVTSDVLGGYMDSANFNSHAHVERDSVGIGNLTSTAISTHTLTWSVTLDVVYIWCLLNVMRTHFFI